jgi:alpha-1,2-mannosyltransferase
VVVVLPKGSARAGTAARRDGLVRLHFDCVRWHGGAKSLWPAKGARLHPFLHLGAVAGARDDATLYDHERLHRAQVELVPVSSASIYPPIYPPQTALIFIPFAALPFGWAAALWGLVNCAVYGLVVHAAWRAVRHDIPDRALVVTGAFAFPPFLYLVNVGQTSIVPMAAFAAAWVSLERSRPWLAGAALGLLAFKPQFGLAVTVVVLASREWRMIGGAVVCLAAQAVSVWLMFGRDVFPRYAASMAIAVANAELLDPKPYLTHAIPTVTRLLPRAIGIPLWLITMSAALWCVVRVWRSGAPLRVRFGMLMAASLIASPHLSIYDLIILFPVALWCGAYVESHGSLEERRKFWGLAHLFVLLVLLPTAAFVKIQISVVVLVGLFLWTGMRVCRWAAVSATFPAERSRS